ncbi:hypothetical protein T439DRAFT_321669 [Meredithblackwellia eburnea MCA 4105]
MSSTDDARSNDPQPSLVHPTASSAFTFPPPHSHITTNTPQRPPSKSSDRKGKGKATDHEASPAPSLSSSFVVVPPTLPPAIPQRTSSIADSLSSTTKPLASTSKSTLGAPFRPYTLPPGLSPNDPAPPIKKPPQQLFPSPPAPQPKNTHRRTRSVTFSPTPIMHPSSPSEESSDDDERSKNGSSAAPPPSKRRIRFAPLTKRIGRSNSVSSNNSNSNREEVSHPSKENDPVPMVVEPATEDVPVIRERKSFLGAMKEKLDVVALEKKRGSVSESSEASSAAGLNGSQYRRDSAGTKENVTGSLVKSTSPDAPVASPLVPYPIHLRPNFSEAGSRTSSYGSSATEIPSRAASLKSDNTSVHTTASWRNKLSADVFPGAPRSRPVSEARSPDLSGGVNDKVVEENTPTLASFRSSSSPERQRSPNRAASNAQNLPTPEHSPPRQPFASLPVHPSTPPQEQQEFQHRGRQREISQESTSSAPSLSHSPAMTSTESPVPTPPRFSGLRQEPRVPATSRSLYFPPAPATTTTKSQNRPFSTFSLSPSTSLGSFDSDMSLPGRGVGDVGEDGLVRAVLGTRRISVAPWEEDVEGEDVLDKMMRAQEVAVVSEEQRESKRRSVLAANLDFGALAREDGLVGFDKQGLGPLDEMSETASSGPRSLPTSPSRIAANQPTIRKSLQVRLLSETYADEEMTFPTPPVNVGRHSLAFSDQSGFSEYTDARTQTPSLPSSSSAQQLETDDSSETPTPQLSYTKQQTSLWVLDTLASVSLESERNEAVRQMGVIGEEEEDDSVPVASIPPASVSTPVPAPVSSLAPTNPPSPKSQSRNVKQLSINPALLSPAATPTGGTPHSATSNPYYAHSNTSAGSVRSPSILTNNSSRSRIGNKIGSMFRRSSAPTLEVPRGISGGPASLRSPTTQQSPSFSLHGFGKSGGGASRRYSQDFSRPSSEAVEEWTKLVESGNGPWNLAVANEAPSSASASPPKPEVTAFAGLLEQFQRDEKARITAMAARRVSVV